MVCFKSSKLVLTAATLGGFFGALMVPSYGAQASGFLTSVIDAPRASSVFLVADNQSEQRQVGAQKFISSMAQNALGFITDESLNRAAKTKAFEKLLRKDFDLRKIGRFAMGQYWNSASDKQRSAYFKLFENMVIDIYSARFSEYGGQDIEVRSARPEGKKDILVRSAIVGGNGPDVDVDWRVRYKSGQYKVIDIVVEGVSMALTQRSEFASVIQRGGGSVDVLIEHLEK